ncbi:MAG: hypothetical protein QXS29_10760 [Nitrososphaeria archaeon]
MDIENLITYYNKITENVIAELEKLASEEGYDIAPYIKNAIMQSTSFMSTKWRTKRKYLRTLSAMKIYSNDYPNNEDMIKLSLVVDAMVNILDDLFDEVLTMEEKSMFILELGKILTYFSSQKMLSADLLKQFSMYIEKIILLGIGDHVLREKLSDIEVAKRHYLLRSMDIDIFVQIPMLFGIEIKNKEQFQKSCRAFRALNLLKKDISDIQHDEKIKQVTPVTIYKNSQDRILELASYFYKIALKDSSKYRNNIEKMCKNEITEIKKLLQTSQKKL